MEKRELSHYGILGMHWGVRRARSSPSQDHVESRQIKKKKLHEMSNAELKKVNERLQLERTYKDLDKKLILVGASLVGGILLNEGRQAAGGFIKKHGPGVLKNIAKYVLNRG